MKSEVSPAVVVGIVVAVLLVVGFFFWKGSAGKTFTKDEAQGRLSISVPAGAPTTTTK